VLVCVNVRLRDLRQRPAISTKASTVFDSLKLKRIMDRNISSLADRKATLSWHPCPIGRRVRQGHCPSPACAWQIGRIYERRGFADAVRWSWSLYGVVLTRPPGINTDGHAATLEAAKAEFGASWKQWLAWARAQGGGVAARQASLCRPRLEG
jgi:hypothetical protein